MNKKNIIEIEKKVLSQIIYCPRLLADVREHLKIDDFTFNVVTQFYSACCELFDQRKTINLTNLVNLINQKNHSSSTETIKQYYDEIVTHYDENDNLMELTEIVYLQAKQKAFDEIVADYQHQRNTNGGSEELITTFQNKFSNFNIDFRQNSTKDAYEVAKEVTKNLLELTLHPELDDRLNTKFPLLDDLTGGFERQQLIFLCARPSQGKTAFAGQLGINMCELMQQRQKNESLVFFSLEMTKESVMKRLLSSISNIPLSHLRGKTTMDEHKQLNISQEKFNGFNFLIEDQPGMTLKNIYNKLVKLKREKNVRVVMIDYLQIIGYGGKKDVDEYQAISKICDGLKQIARELDVTLICLSQLNRSVEARQDKRPNMSDIKGSGNAEANADIIMLLYREDYYSHAANRPSISEMEVNISKNRNGSTGMVKFDFYLEYAHFEEKTPEFE